jgi:hypothetical protein
MKRMAVSPVTLRHEGAGVGVHHDPAPPPAAAPLPPAQGPSHEGLLEAPVLCAPQIVGPGHWKKNTKNNYPSWILSENQGCGSGLDPDSIGSLDPDSESGSGSRRAKMTHKNSKKNSKFMFWTVGWLLLRAEGFFCNLDVLRIGKL